MKQIKIALITLLLSAATATAQGTVEKSLFNFQTGTVGFWGSHEARLGSAFALRSEIGFDLWLYETYNDKTGSALVPSISLEPRWYYNIANRSGKGKNTAKNSANFFSINVEYYPDAFVIGDIPDNIFVPNQIDIIPKWGIRRHIGNSNFNYEAGIGIGYKMYLDKDDEKVIRNTDNLALDIHLRIGDTF
ncbi:hypothetical protein [Flavobacterium sp. MK4S-17]|uniref:hypothetical protein n=1 Tax=Flavobacterium sp. MK4S-17 TaxID=2543737 RepID=UPI001358628A|nr:hypothetical protein [Flavobacterium sp. MK4S-17]